MASIEIHSAEEVPAAPFYVLYHDNYLSDWGDAYGKTNTLIFPCQTREQAIIVKGIIFEKTGLDRRCDETVDEHQSQIAETYELIRGKLQLDFDEHLYILMSEETTPYWYDPVLQVKKREFDKQAA